MFKSVETLFSLSALSKRAEKNVKLKNVNLSFLARVIGAHHQQVHRIMRGEAELKAEHKAHALAYIARQREQLRQAEDMLLS